MADLIFVLALFGLALFLFAGVGQALWLAVAWLFRQGSGFEGETTVRLCRRCGSPLQAAGCLTCRWPGPITAVARREVLVALKRRIEQHAEADLLDGQAATRLMMAVTAEQERLAGLPTATAVPAAVVVAPAGHGGAVSETPLEQAPIAPAPIEQVSSSAVPVSGQLPYLERSTASQPEAAADRPKSPAVPPQDVAARAAAYAARRSVAGQEREQPTRERPTARPLSQLLSAFLEEKNIRWGELAGGLLIVSCSIALVISFWWAIAERPFLKFVVFNGVTAAIFAAGLYTERRWRLPTTSRGIFVIGSLLVPLNFLAIAAMSPSAAPVGALVVVGELLSIALFAWLLLLAARSIAASWPWLLMLGVILPAAAELLVRRFTMPGLSPWQLAALALVPLGAYVGIAARMVQRALRWPAIAEVEANVIFRSLGIMSFAVFLPLALLMAKTGDVAAGLRQLAPLATLLATPSIAMGLVFWRRVADPSLAPIRTAGTALAVLGAMVSLAATVLAWPQPAQMLVAAVLNFALLTGVAIVFVIPAAHLVAAVCAVVAYLVTALIAAGELGWLATSAAMAEALFSAQAGRLLVPIVGVYGLVAAWAAHRARPAAPFLAAAGAMIAVVSLLLVGWHGLARSGDPEGAAWVFGLYAGAMYVAALFRRFDWLAWCGSVLMLAALVQACVFGSGFDGQWQRSWLTALLLHATASVAIAAAGRWLMKVSPAAWQQSIGEPRCAGKPQALREQWKAALTTSCASPALVGLVALHNPPAEVVPYLAWLATIWLVIAWLAVHPAVFVLFQAGLVGTVMFSVAAALQSQAWFIDGRWPWLDPYMLQAQGIALALLAAAWFAVRRGVLSVAARSRAADRLAATDELPAQSAECRGQAVGAPWWSPLVRLLSGHTAALDQTLHAAVLVILVLVAVYAALPGVLQELTPRDAAVHLHDLPTEMQRGRIVPPTAAFEIPGIEHEHAAAPGAWALWVAVVGASAVMLGGWGGPTRIHALALSVWLVCPLMAVPFEADVAAASALRWISAAFLLAAAIASWGVPVVLQSRRPSLVPQPRALSEAFSLVLGLTALPLAGMAAYVAVLALVTQPPTRELLHVHFVLGSLGFIGIAILAAVLMPTPRPPRQQSEATRQKVSIGFAALSAVCLLPLACAFSYAVAASLRKSPIAGPDPGSLFFQLGPAVSYVVPVLLIAWALISEAVRRGSEVFAFMAGLLLAIAATAGYLMTPFGAVPFDAVLWVRLVQVNALVFGAYALLWFAARALRRSCESSRDLPVLLTAQAMLAPALIALAGIPALAGLWLDPRSAAVPQEFATLLGWSSFATALAAAAFWSWQVRRLWKVRFAGPALFSLAAMAAFAAGRTYPGTWVAYHTAMFGILASGGLVLIGAWIATHRGRLNEQERTLATLFATVAVGLTVAFALRGVGTDPAGISWSASAIAGASMLTVGLACWAGRREFLYLAAALINVAATIVWIEWRRRTGAVAAGQGLRQLLQVNVIALGLPAIAWVLLERRALQSRSDLGNSPGVHRIAAAICLSLVGLLAITGLAADAGGSPVAQNPWFTWTAWAATLVAAGACLWDERARGTVLSFYLLGFFAIGLALDGFDLAPQMLLWSGTMLTAAYTVAASYLWSRRQGLLRLGDRLGMLRSPDSSFAGLQWLVPATGLLVSIVTLLGFGSVLTLADWAQRISAAQAVMAQAIALALLARGERRSRLQWGSLAVLALGCVAFGWAFISPGAATELLDRMTVLTVVLAALAAVYGLGITKLLAPESEWMQAARRLIPALVVLETASIVSLITTEVTYYLTRGQVPMTGLAIVAATAALVGLAAAAIAAAVLPGRDPLRLTERGRTAYVYAAEALLAFAGLHVRLSAPWLFSGFFRQYWPFLAMLVAYLGVGLAELFRRQRRIVLAEPLERTGALLPVLPVLGFWAVPVHGDYSLLLLAVGVLYGVLAVMRRSFAFGLLAVLAANGSLWYFFQHTGGIGFFDHPQLWLIPPALCALVAAYLNREHLTDAQMTQIRYVASMVIYVSSTADIFLNGVTEAPWLPLVLAALSVAGVFAGILLRVRAFLFLGTSFLVLALFTMIWHAAHDLDQNWIWAASGIVLGILIIALFATFEKKRQEVLELVERVKGWDA